MKGIKAMKTLRVLLGLLLTIAAASAQYVSPPAKGPCIATSTAFMIPGITTTNLPSTLQAAILPGALGVGFTLEMGATNAASTTNATITLEGSQDGVYWIDTPTSALPLLSVPQNGTSPQTFFTNILATGVNLGNVVTYRVKSIQNTNLASIWITNFTWTAR